MRSLLRWFGLSESGVHRHGAHEHGQGHDHDGHGHAHSHGIVDPSIAASAQGISAVKTSFVILAATALLQLVVAYASGSVALLADTIHNLGDATTALPLWLAFSLARRRPTRTFNYGLGRVEDLAGIAIVLIIFASAIVAFYEAIDRLFNPQAVEHIGWLAVAGLTGFVGNEAVAVFRIKVGRRIDSAALVADGYHARTDGLTSLAVVVGAIGVWLGYPLADPIVGLMIAAAILVIVWQSAGTVLRRMLDGVEPQILDEIEHAAAHVGGGGTLTDVRARWVGHRLHAELTVALADDVTLATAGRIAETLQNELSAHLPALERATIQFRSA